MDYGEDIGPLPEWLQSRDWERDKVAQNEIKDWAKLDNIEDQKQKNLLRIHRCLGYIIPASLIFIFAIFLLAIGIYAWHLLTPESWQFLSMPQIAELHNILFSSIVGAGVSQLARQYLR